MMRPQFSSHLSLVLAAAVAVSHAGAARAAEPAPVPAAPPPAEPAAPPPAEPAALDGETLTAVNETSTRAPDVSYGLALRGRWVSVPKWMLDLFTKRNMPLSSSSWALEFMRRRGGFDISVAVGYMGLSPNDGNWLGRNNDPAVETDFVQFRNFGMWTADISFVKHSYLNDWFGLHYGAGIGAGLVTGKMLRTSNWGNCTEANSGDLMQCHPVGVTCGPTGCNEDQLNNTMLNTNMDRPETPRRFAEPSVPGVLPIVHVLAGIDFRLPHVRGWEAKVEAGFYDAFFLGGGVGYTF
jgi:hypothetical protein